MTDLAERTRLICKHYQTQEDLTDNEFAFALGINNCPGGLGWAGWLSGEEVPSAEDLTAIKLEYKDWRMDLAISLEKMKADKG